MNFEKYKYAEGTRKPNFLKIPVNNISMDSEGIKEFNDILKNLKENKNLSIIKSTNSGGISFNEYFEKHVPKVLWNCEVVKISMDADSIIENACDELHEDARNNISDEKELQEFLDKWCEKQTGTTTYYPCYKEYVKVQKEWFD